MEIERYLAELSDSKQPLAVSKLVNLAELSREEVEVFRRLWPTIDVTRRRQVVKRLAEMAEDNLELDLDKVFRLCLSDADSQVRAEALEGLWQSEDRSLIAPLISLLLTDEVPAVRAAAAKALRKFTMFAELGKLPKSDAEKLEHALVHVFKKKDETPEVRRRALEAISPLDKPEVKELIGEAYHGDDPKLRVSAVYAMGQNCDLRWLPTLLVELCNAGSEMRFEAAKACGELEAEQAVPRLVKATRDPDAEVRIAAISALGKIGGAMAKERLRQCLASPDEAVRDAAKEALTEIGFWEGPFIR